MPYLSAHYYADLPSGKLPDLTGRYIGSGRYKLVEKIGQGSFGIIYLGQNMRTNPRQYVAIKCTVEGRNTSIRSEIELQAQAGAATAGVLGIQDVIDDEDWNLTFIVTDYCPDGDLFEAIHTEKRRFRDVEHVRSIFLQILDAVMVLHEKGIYHRDLKPENVLCLDGGNRVVLTDFGFATTEMYTAQFGMGTETYMSPEVQGGMHIKLRNYSSPLADVWALGILLLNLVNGGDFPWKSAKMSDAFFFHYIMHNPDYLEHHYGLSGELNDLLKCIFTANPRNRISLGEFRQRVKTMRAFRAPRQYRPRTSVRTHRGWRMVDEMEMPYEGKGKGVDRRRPEPQTRTPLSDLLFADVCQRSDSNSSNSCSASSSFEALREECMTSHISVGSQQWPSGLSPSSADAHAALAAMMSNFLGGVDIDSITEVETAPLPPPRPQCLPLTVRNPSPPSTDSLPSPFSNYDNDFDSAREAEEEDDEESEEAITPETHAAAVGGEVSTFDLNQSETTLVQPQAAVVGDIPIVITFPTAKIPTALETVSGGTYTASDNLLKVAARRMKMRGAKAQTGIVVNA